MRSYLELASLALYALAAVLWIISALARLAPIAPGLEELDKVHLLVRDLQNAAWWSAGAAISTALAVAAQVATRYWPGG